MATAPALAPLADRAAVLTKATVRAAHLLGLSHAALGRIIGVSPATVSRMASGNHALVPGTKPAELATLVVRLYRSLDALVGNDEQARKAWMAGFHEAFGRPPREAIATVDGLTHVVRYLDGSRALV